jgi:hypothetical protein
MESKVEEICTSVPPLRALFDLRRDMLPTCEPATDAILEIVLLHSEHQV